MDQYLVSDYMLLLYSGFQPHGILYFFFFLSPIFSMHPCFSSRYLLRRERVKSCRLGLWGGMLFAPKPSEGVWLLPVIASLGGEAFQTILKPYSCISHVKWYAFVTPDSAHRFIYLTQRYGFHCYRARCYDRWCCFMCQRRRMSLLFTCF